jgi:hypothetical protein
VLLNGGEHDGKPAGKETEEEEEEREYPDARDILSNSALDSAPFEPDTLFVPSTADINGRTFTEAATDRTALCTEAATEELADTLVSHDCIILLRATYRTDAVALTIGIAQFPNQRNASDALEEAVGTLRPLVNDATPSFCQEGGCRTAMGPLGRYGYFIIAGNADGSPDDGDDDSPAAQAARDALLSPNSSSLSAAGARRSPTDRKPQSAVRRP